MRGVEVWRLRESRLGGATFIHPVDRRSWLLPPNSFPDQTTTLFLSPSHLVSFLRHNQAEAKSAMMIRTSQTKAATFGWPRRLASQSHGQVQPFPTARPHFTES